MHNALLIDEIQRLIFSFCLHKDLAFLACACHAFSPAALDLRWQSLSSVVGLLLLIPGVQLTDNTLVGPTLLIMIYGIFMLTKVFLPALRPKYQRARLDTIQNLCFSCQEPLASPSSS